MEAFRTTFKISPAVSKISFDTGCFFIGSCFTENIGKKLQDLKFKCLINPYGIIYNPVSITNALSEILEGKVYRESDLIKESDEWISFNHHGHFRSESASETLLQINNSITEATEFLKNAGFLFITLGTARVYLHKETSKIVANNHKLPGYKFDKWILKPDEIISVFRETILKIREVNPTIKICFTISPVRHWADGAVENQYSKSVLHVAINEIVRTIRDFTYFPAYEIQMDDLRDYRFYDKDMIHPNQVAIEYIMDKFSETYIDKTALALIPKLEMLQKAMGHRIMKNDKQAVKKFVAAQLNLIEEIRKTNSNLDLEVETKYFSNMEKSGSV